MRKITLHRFHVDNNEGESGIGYDIIIGNDLMVKIGLSVDFKSQVLQWYSATLPIKEPRSLQRQTYLTSCEMHKVLIQTA